MESDGYGWKESANIELYYSNKKRRIEWLDFHNFSWSLEDGSLPPELNKLWVILSLRMSRADNGEGSINWFTTHSGKKLLLTIGSVFKFCYLFCSYDLVLSDVGLFHEVDYETWLFVPLLKKELPTN